MKLINLHIRNFRSFVDSGDIRIESLQGFVGENNSGKSNLLYAMQVFLTSGAGGAGKPDFHDPNYPMIITATFGGLSSAEKKKLRKYILGDKLILEKHINYQEDPKSGKLKASAEYHGYLSKPRDWWLSVEGVEAQKGVEEQKGSKPKWEEIAKAHGLIDYVRDVSGKVTKRSYESGLQRFLIENEDIEYIEPELGKTHALGLQPVLLDALPRFHLLPAITDYSDEIDKRSTTSTFRRLMGELSDRILRGDPRFQQIEATLKKLTSLLNPPKEGEQREKGDERLSILDKVEGKLQELISGLMPSVCGVRVEVAIEESRDVFSRGVSIWVNDGKLTEVLMKGHGLQRCVVFCLIQALILNQRGQLIPASDVTIGSKTEGKSIILAIEEPELYIHPQIQRLIFGVLRGFAETDQVIYSTHSPMFIDVGRYERIGVVRKDLVETGTYVLTCDPGTLDETDERKTFQFLSSFGLEENQMFFAKKIILLEGEQDIIALLASGRELSLFSEFPEEIGYSIIATGNKEEMPKYMKLLNGFNIPYVVLHELDGKPDNEINQKIISLLRGNKVVTIETRLEDIVSHEGHFKNKYVAKRFFENASNITETLKSKVKDLFT